MNIAIITPSIGRLQLKNAIDSVRDLILSDSIKIKHYIIFDGPDARAKYTLTLPSSVCEMTIPFNTGGGGFYGHKIIGAMCTLLKEDWVCFLDDDNTFEPDHLIKLAEVVKNKDWAFSYRNMYLDGKFQRRDTYESLGPFRVVSTDPNYKFLIDTNCFLIKRAIAASAWSAWATGWGSDRVLANYLMVNFPKYACSYSYTVNYEASKELILDGYAPPIDEPPVFVFHMTRDATKKAIQQWEYYQKINSECSEDEEPYYDPQIGQKQWQINFFINSPFPIVNGYESFRYAPAGSIFLFNLFDINSIPKEAYERKDVHKILYTIESPNINYIKNWTTQTLSNFDAVITYWEDAKHPNIISHPFVNKLNLSTTVEKESILNPTNRDESICCVLNNRPTKGSYHIDSTKLEALDYLRYESLKSFLEYGYKVMAYGDSWRESSIPYRTTKSRFLDIEYVTDIYKRHRYVYISENTNARGYVSEKIFDALIAGCIPIYCCDRNNYDFVKKEFGKVAIIILPGEIPDLNFQRDESTVQLLLSKYSIDKLLLKIQSYKNEKRAIFQ